MAPERTKPVVVTEGHLAKLVMSVHVALATPIES